MESLWRLGLAAEFFLVTCSIVLAVILFALLRPVNQYMALLAFSFNLVSLAVEAANDLNLLAALFPLGNVSYLKALQSEQISSVKPPLLVVQMRPTVRLVWLLVSGRRRIATRMRLRPCNRGYAVTRRDELDQVTDQLIGRW